MGTSMAQIAVDRSKDIGIAELMSKEGKVTQRRVFGNITCTSGFQLICIAVGSPASNSAGTPGARYVVIGSHQGTPGAGDTAMGGELGRGYGSFHFPSGSKYFTVYKTFPAGSATGAVQESGLINKSSGGALLNRGTFAVINKGASDSLKMTWQISFS
jgi:hypothetical protein